MTPLSSTALDIAPDTALTRGFKKKARTRQGLVDAAVRIYARKGVEALALNELAEEAGVANGTVYNYFKTREEVLAAVGIELANQLSQQVSALSESVENGAERVAIGVRVFLLRAQQDPVWARAVVGVFQFDRGMRSVVAGHLLNDLQIGVRQGVLQFPNELLAMTLVASATLGAMSAVVEGIVTPGMDGDMAEMVLKALSVPDADAARIARLPLPTPAAEDEAPVKRRGRPRRA